MTAIALAATVVLVCSAAMAEEGVTADSILLGQSCALKGPAEGLGTNMKLGLEIYFDKVNKSGGVDGRKIELKSLNDGYEPDRCKQTTTMLIEKMKVFALIGEVGTPTSKVAVPIAEQHQVPFVGPFTGAEFLRNPFKKYVVNLRGSYYQEMERLAEYLVDVEGLQKIACFYQNDGYGQAGLSGIKLALERRNMSLAAEGNYERNTIAISEGLDAIAKASPDAVVMVGAYKPCAAFIKSAKENGNLKNAVFCNISFVGTKNLMQELGSAADEKCVVSQVVPYPWDTGIPVVKEYHDAMKSAGHGGEIGFISLEGYLVAKLFCQIVQNVQGDLTRESFLNAVGQKGTYDLGGVTLQFGPDDHQGMDEVFLTTFQGGNVVPIKITGGTASVDVP